MADYCGEYGRGIRSPFDERGRILGDFLEDFEMLEAELGPFMLARLGICEGHGTGVQVTCDPEGRLWFEHVPLGRRKRKGTPEPVEIPRSLPEANVLPARGELEALVVGFVEHVLPTIPDLRREDAFWKHNWSTFKLRRLRDKVEARAKSSAVPVPDAANVAAAPPPTAAEMAEVLERVERAVLRRFRTLDSTPLGELASALRVVVARLEALEKVAKKRSEAFWNEEWQRQVAEKQAQNAAERAAAEERRQEYLAEQREKRLAALGRKRKG